MMKNLITAGLIVILGVTIIAYTSSNCNDCKNECATCGDTCSVTCNSKEKK